MSPQDIFRYGVAVALILGAWAAAENAMVNGGAAGMANVRNDFEKDEDERALNDKVANIADLRGTAWAAFSIVCAAASAYIAHP